MYNRDWEMLWKRLKEMVEKEEIGFEGQIDTGDLIGIMEELELEAKTDARG